MFAGLFGCDSESNSEITEWKDEENPKSKSNEEDSITTLPDQSPASCLCEKRWSSKDLNLPPLHLPDTEKNKEEYLEKGVPLYKAILNGDLIKVKLILRENAKRLLYSSLTEGYETALHVAVRAGQATMVKELVVQMESKDLELQDSTGNTAFCIATAGGGVEIAKILMEKNPQLPFLRGACNKTPLNIAAVYGNPEMIRFLNKKFEEHIHHLNKVELEEIFFACINAQLFGSAIKMLEDGQSLAWARNKDGEMALEILARMLSALGSKSTLGMQQATLLDYNMTLINRQRAKLLKTAASTWKKALELTKLLFETMLSDGGKSLRETIDQTSELLFEAARLGNHNFVAVLISCYPNLILKKDEKKGTIFHVAVLHRQHNIFKQIHNMGIHKDIIVSYDVQVPDEKENDKDKDKDFICYNMLHLAAKLPSDRVDTDPVTQMQQELQWFKAVEKLMQPSEREKRDSKYHLTPQELFTKEHSELRKAAEEWMKNIGQSGMIVATLVTTIAFTITSSLAGGNDSNTGIPTNINRNMFPVFVLAAAVAMFSSITSALAYLLASTMRFTKESFLDLIPHVLRMAVMMLFLSIVGITVAFVGILFLAYRGKHDMWVPLLAIGMSVFLMFYVLQYLSAAVISGYYPLAPSPRLSEPSKAKFWEVLP